MEGQVQKDLVDAIAAWMRFEILCGRGDLLCEAMLSQPLAQLFVANDYRVRPEVTYPGGKQTTKPPKLDYVIMKREK